MTPKNFELIVQVKLSIQSLWSSQININEYRPCSTKAFLFVPSWLPKLWHKRMYSSIDGQVRETSSQFMNSHNGIATYYFQGGAAGSCRQVNAVSNSLRRLVTLELQDIPLCKSQYRFMLESVGPTQLVFLYLFISCLYSGGLRLAKPTH